MSRAKIDIFNGDITSLQTNVYARVTLPAGSDMKRYRLEGTVVGPYSDYAQTLSAKYELRDCGPGEDILAKATILDPCTWMPGMPFRYRLEFDLFRDAQRIETGIREFGLRNIVAQQRSILLAGQRTVLRGVGYARARFADISQWRDLATAILVEEPDEALCETASRLGIGIVAQLSHNDDLPRRFRRITAYPSVLVVLLDWNDTAENWRRLMPNVLLAESWPRPGDEEPWSDLLVCEIGRQPPNSLPTDITKPILALRPLPKRAALADARAACDTLQRDLAPHFNLAGYFV